MRHTIIIAIIFLFGTCKCMGPDNRSNLLLPDSKTVTVKLIDSLGTITFSIPNRYDTFFKWTNHSDCGKPCDKEQYRFQPKRLPITKESGWLWLGEPQDSIERFTIFHSAYFPFHNNTKANAIENYHKNKREQLLNDPITNNIKSDTIEKLNDRYFSIIIIDIYDTVKAQYSKKIFAATTIKANIVEFKYELLTKKKDSINGKFIESSKQFLETIRINKDI